MCTMYLFEWCVVPLLHLGQDKYPAGNILHNPVETLSKARACHRGAAHDSPVPARDVLVPQPQVVCDLLEGQRTSKILLVSENQQARSCQFLGKNTLLASNGAHDDV